MSKFGSTVRPLALALAAMIGFAAGAKAGPPWISVEYPSNPHHATTRGANFLVHAYHHGSHISMPVSARAEGLVNGQRRSVRLEVLPTNRHGVFALRSAVPEEGSWIVVVTLAASETSEANALVTLGRDGEVLTVRVPSEKTRDGWVVPRPVTAEEIDAQLREAARLASSGEDVLTHRLGVSTAAIGILPLALLLFAAGVERRSRVRGRTH